MSDDKPIIIKKIKKGGHGGHHGGAWKIAYADFVTAMMAFFLLMWLLNATTEEQKRGIANYFDPVTIGERMGGGEGVMMGESITSKDATAQSSMGAMSIKESKPQEKGQGGEQESSSEKKENDDELQQQIQAEEASFEDIKKSLESALSKDPELKEWLQNLLIDETPEGLRIQILDQNEKSMFPSGSSKMYDHTKKLLQHVASIIRKVPNKISISGHTDATPYSTKDYTNWELSSDRANASRRVLGESGIDDNRFVSVVGREAKDPFVKNDPLSPQNRRISIVLLRKTPLPQKPSATSKKPSATSKKTSSEKKV